MTIPAALPLSDRPNEAHYLQLDRPLISEELMATLRVAPHTGDAILLNRQETGPWSYRGASDAMIKMRKTIGAVDYDIHSIRHTVAAELATAGASDEEGMAVTGHSTKKMFEHYAGKPIQQKRAVDALAKRVSNSRLGLPILALFLPLRLMVYPLSY